MAFVKGAVQGGGVRSDPDDQGKSPVVWRVDFKPGTGITLGQLDPVAVEEVQAGSDRFGFLPRWYREEILRNPS